MITAKDIRFDSNQTIDPRDYLFPLVSSAYEYMKRIMKYNNLDINLYNKTLLFSHFFHPVIKHKGRDNHEAETLGYMLNPHCLNTSLENCRKPRPKEQQ